jgi:hypothetical protein
MLTVFRVMAWVGREFRAPGLRAQFFHQGTLAATIALGSLALLLLCLTERPASPKHSELSRNSSAARSLLRSTLPVDSSADGRPTIANATPAQIIPLNLHQWSFPCRSDVRILAVPDARSMNDRAPPYS